MWVSRHWIFFKLDQLNFQVIANVILDFFPSACWNIHFEYSIHRMFPLTLYFYKYSDSEGRVIRTVKKHWPKFKTKYIPFQRESQWETGTELPHSKPAKMAPWVNALATHMVRWVHPWDAHGGKRELSPTSHFWPPQACVVCASYTQNEHTHTFLLLKDLL